MLLGYNIFMNSVGFYLIMRLLIHPSNHSILLIGELASTLGYIVVYIIVSVNLDLYILLYIDLLLWHLPDSAVWQILSKL